MDAPPLSELLAALGNVSVPPTPSDWATLDAGAAPHRGGLRRRRAQRTRYGTAGGRARRRPHDRAPAAAWAAAERRHGAFLPFVALVRHRDGVILLNPRPPALGGSGRTSRRPGKRLPHPILSHRDRVPRSLQVTK